MLNAVKLDMNQNELDVLVSLAFNIGSGTFSNFHIDQKLNAGDRVGAADQSLVWSKAGGKSSMGSLPAEQRDATCSSRRLS
ncbi:GH24 family phage-related lysozyme (muramidase) [Phyllobacterium ifriqiyense]